MAIVMKTLGVVGIFNPMRIDAATDDTPINLGKYNPSDNEITRAFAKVAELKKRGYPIVNSYTHLDKLQRLPMSYRCHWPKVMLPIEANGDVVDCMYWGQRPIGNVRDAPFSEILDAPRLRALAGEAGEACHKCVSVHRVDVSEAWEGRLEPAVSWLRTVV
jgi:MoaA/NifB/PqqE/SkfB family radical SAM enzyme